jgi:secondary thiamine-phosphate synthase enzyme
MAAFQRTFRVSTKGHCDVQDVTVRIEQVIAASGVRLGIVNVSGKGSTLAVTTIEFEPGAVSDLKRALEEIAPENDDYAHNARWGDHNGFAHLRSALMGTARSYAIRDGQLDIGTWQQIVLCDFDDRPREREVTVTIVGE